MRNPILKLGYAGIRGDLDEWERFACDLFGLQAVRQPGELRFRADTRAWRLAVRRSDNPGLDYLGFEVATREDLDGIATRLIAAGHEAEEDDASARLRDVQRLLRTRAPDGTRLEFFVGALTVSTPFLSPTGARFVTGNAGLGHVLLLVPDLPAALTFFTDVIGLRRTDSIEVAPGCDGHFLNGGLRHHIVALAKIPDVVGFDHIYLEVEDLTSVGQAWDKVMAGAAPIARSIGQHANDPAISFYVGSPSGFLFEYGLWINRDRQLRHLGRDPVGICIFVGRYFRHPCGRVIFSQQNHSNRRSLCRILSKFPCSSWERGRLD